MFEVLVYLYHNYYTPQACPAADVLARRLAAAGFEHDDIDDALSWLMGLAQSTETFGEFPLTELSNGQRFYTDEEQQRLGVEAIGLIMFLEEGQALSAPLREILIERAMASHESPVSLETMKIIALLVLWSQEIEVDLLIMEELILGEGDRQTH